VLEHIGEFGIVFLMFTIGLEGAIMVIAVFGFNIDTISALIISTAFALSSTAVVLSYLKHSKEIHTPYGKRATGILIFQDIAVIPLLIFLGFLVNEGHESVWIIIRDTAVSAIIVISLLFVVGRHVMTWLLKFSASSDVDELFMGSVLFIVVGASLLASYFDFTYSLGAFVAGMIIAETKYHHKVFLL